MNLTILVLFLLWIVIHNREKKCKVKLNISKEDSQDRVCLWFW